MPRFTLVEYDADGDKCGPVRHYRQTNEIVPTPIKTLLTDPDVPARPKAVEIHHPDGTSTEYTLSPNNGRGRRD